MEFERPCLPVSFCYCTVVLQKEKQKLQNALARGSLYPGPSFQPSLRPSATGRSDRSKTNRHKKILLLLLLLLLLLSSHVQQNNATQGNKQISKLEPHSNRESAGERHSQHITSHHITPHGGITRTDSARMKYQQRNNAATTT